jgi:hypothetical protein
MPHDFTCDLCGADTFSRQIHLDAHRGTRRCLLNRASCAFTRGTPPESMRNIARSYRSKVATFVEYLKANLVLSAATAAAGTTSCDFVPFAGAHGCAPGDVGDMADAIKESATACCVNLNAKATRPRLLATCLAAAIG